MQKHDKLQGRRAIALKLSAILAGISLVAMMAVEACSNGAPPVTDNGGTVLPPPSTGCSNPAAGCTCATPGETAACGSTIATTGGKTTCQEGTLTCGADGVWSGCVPTYTSFLSAGGGVTLHEADRNFHPLNTPGAPPTTIISGDAAQCDPCDPYCQAFPTSSAGVDGGYGLLATDGGGWTLADVFVPGDGSNCVGNQCYINYCDGGAGTQIVGRVLDPAGNYPINNALVLIPNGGIITPMGTGLGYDPCLGSNLPVGAGYAYTDTNGNFIIGNNPADAAAGGGSVPTASVPLDGGTTPSLQVPLLIQVGRWRRLVMTSAAACVVSDAGPITLPQVQGGPYGQDNIPHIGIVTSSCDPFECMINDIGVDRTQFSGVNGGGRIELAFAQNEQGGGVNTGGNQPAAIVLLSDGGTVDAATSGYDQLLKTPSVMSNYDLIMLPCRCADEYEGPSGADYTTATTATDYNDQNGYRQNVLSYANAGGRVFTSHWGREWIERQALGFDAGSPGVCSGSGTCATDLTQGACTADPTCTWSGTCTGGSTCGNASSQTLKNCAVGSGCGFSGAGASGNGCNSTGACTAPAAQVDLAACNSLTGCTFAGGASGNGCNSTGTCATAPQTTSSAQCSAVTGCGWSGGCNAPTCTATTRSACTGTAGCTFTGACTQTTACPTATAATTQTQCQTSPTGDPECAWTGACSQTTACPAMTASLTKAQCTTSPTGDPECAWTGSCVACSTATTLAACNTAGCSWGGGCTQTIACPAVTGTLTKTQCQTSPTGDAQCGWTGGCKQTIACPANSATLTKTQCQTAPTGDSVCGWNGACAAPNCSATTQATCTTAGCTWSGACSQAIACPAQTPTLTQAQCQTSPTGDAQCAWSGCTGPSAATCSADSTSQAACLGAGCGFTGGCSGPSSASCTSQTSSAACGSVSGCQWGGGCASVCGGATTQTACNALGSSTCKWSTGELLCLPAGGSCTGLGASACGATAGCSYDGCTAPTCTATTQAACGTGCTWSANCTAPNCSATTQATCTNTGCTWGGGCSATTTCTSQTSASACGGLTGCTWSGTGCTGASAATCALATVADNNQDCSAAGCKWTGGCTTSTACTSTAAEASPAACGAGCTWDSTLVACASSNLCPTKTTQSTCQAVASTACTWGGVCSGTGLAAACSLLSTGSQNSCAAGGCLWAGGACTTTGNCTSATAEASQTACAAVTNGVLTGGCTWGTPTCTTTNNCTTTAANASAAACGAVVNGALTGGCTWTGAGCSGPSASTCNADLTAATCTGGCQWNGTCSQTTPCATGNTVVASSCTTNPLCTWSGSCSQTTACPTVNTTTASTCAAADPQCAWTGSCASVCGSEVTAATCKSGCSWSGGCANACTGTTPLFCTAVTGCSWSGATGPGPGAVPYGWAPFPNVATWVADNGTPADTNGYFNATPAFTRGSQMAAWLQATGISPSAPFSVSVARTDVQNVLGNSALFVYGWENSDPSSPGSIDAGTPVAQGGPNTVYDFTFDPPLDAGVDGSIGAGRVMYTDMHLSESTQYNPVPATIKVAGVNTPFFNTSYTAAGGAHECYPPDAGLNAQERVAEYLFFDLGACTGSGLGIAIGAGHYFDSETYTLDLCMAPSGAATGSGCPNSCSAANSAVAWRDFDWTAIIPSESDGGSWGADSGLGPSLVFGFQTAQTEAELGLVDGGLSAGASAVYTLPADTTSGAYFKDVNAVIGQPNQQTWLRITMTLNPDSTHQIAPTLTNYRQQFDCISSQ